MSALHRLKAYFGMVPPEEFNAEEFNAEEFNEAEFGTGAFRTREFNPAEFDSAEFDGHHPAYRSGHQRPGDDNQGDDSQHHGSFASGPGHDRGHDRGHHAAPRMRATGSPSWAAEPQGAESCATGRWSAQAPVLGSLAIDATTSKIRSPASQPVAPHRVMPEPRTGALSGDFPRVGGEDTAHSLARIVTLHPRTYNEARPIGERYREGNPVIINLTAMEDRDAKRLVDFAAGLAFALRGSIDKVTNKVFLLSPPNVDVSAADRRRIAEGRF
ncbi:MAG: cell division protein SepF [Pseudonocardiaceae bacterium]